MSSAKAKSAPTKNQSRKPAPPAKSGILPDPRIRAICFALFAAVVVVYWRSLSNQFIEFDDNVYVTGNDHVRAGLTLAGLRWAFTDTSTGNWHPLTWISHMMDVEWFGLKPGGHHLRNVLWHAINGVLLFLTLWRATGRLWRSALAAAVFALHPLRVESVAWASERKDVLSSFFYLCTLLAYIRYVRGPRTVRRYAMVCLALLLGLMSKPSVVSAPFLLLLLDYWPLSRKERFAALLREKIPLFALAIGVSLVTFLSQQQAGATAVIEHLSLAERLSNAAVSYVLYIGKFLWPHDLAAIYIYQRHLPGAAVAGSALLLAAITLVAFTIRRSAPYVLVGWLWFIGTMLPMAGIVQVGRQAYADRYTYIPAIGLTVAIIWMAAGLVERRHWERGAAIAAAAILTALSLATVQQIPYWHDDLSVFQHAAAVTKGNYFAEYRVGKDMVDVARNKEALPHLQEALRTEPEFYPAVYVLGKGQAAVGENQAAIGSFSEAIRLKPDYAEAYYARASTLMQMGNSQYAEPDFQAALKNGLSDDWAPSAHVGLGVILAQRGDVAGGTAEFENAVRLNPGLVEAQRNLANALVQQGRIGDAIARLDQAISITHDAGLTRMVTELRSRNSTR